TYASWWIRQSITRALSQKSRTIRLPLHLSGQLRRITTVNQIMGQELGREPSDEELAARLDMNPAEIREALEADPQIIALEMPIGDGSEFGDLIEDEGSTNPDDTMRKIILREVLDRIINELMPREARIIRLRFGLEDGSPQTLEEIGQALGLSRERIRQIERQVLHRLRQPHFAHRLQELIV
ncbi:MAG: sigma-70 family RNA polymerase sigma factor, partial [Anaerolineae bacterium]|nr:sigma-70 family RNA polymerase sigma factor [Anaerolineae bacterium]